MHVQHAACSFLPASLIFPAFSNRVMTQLGMRCVQCDLCLQTDGCRRVELWRVLRAATRLAFCVGHQLARPTPPATSTASAPGETEKIQFTRCLDPWGDWLQLAGGNIDVGSICGMHNRSCFLTRELTTRDQLNMVCVGEWEETCHRNSQLRHLFLTSGSPVNTSIFV